jgi:hypothetical protein
MTSVNSRITQAGAGLAGWNGLRALYPEFVVTLPVSAALYPKGGFHDLPSVHARNQG